MTNLKIKISIITTLFSLILLLSCKKTASDAKPSPVGAIITINAPIDATEYEVGDTVFINSKITSTSILYGYEVHMIRLADTTEILSKNVHIDANTYDINEYWINDGKVHSEMELEIKALTDHSGNSVSKKVIFHCHAI